MQQDQSIAFYKNRGKPAGFIAAALLGLSFCAFPAQAAQHAKIMGAEKAFNVPAGEYILDKNHANVLWSVTHFGLSQYYGRFDNISASLNLDAQNIAKSSLHVEIAPKSVDTNHTSKPNMFNEEIAGPKMLDAAKFPLITFDSTKITLTGAKTGKVEGDLTLHGVTKPVTLNVTFNNSVNPHPKMKSPALGFSAKTAFKRSDFGLSMLQPHVGDEVKATIETEFYRKPAQGEAMKKTETSSPAAEKK